MIKIILHKKKKTRNEICITCDFVTEQHQHNQLTNSQSQNKNVK